MPIAINKRWGQSGFGLVEVLVAVLILGVGVLGFAGMQLKALKSSEQSFSRIQATILAKDIVSRIAVNPYQITKYVAGPWSTTATNSGTPSYWGDCQTAGCSQSELATWDVKQVVWLAAHLLPNGSANTAKCAGAETYCVTVAWGGTTTSNCAPGGNQNGQCVVLQVVP